MHEMSAHEYIYKKNSPTEKKKKDDHKLLTLCVYVEEYLDSNDANSCEKDGNLNFWRWRERYLRKRED